MAWFKPPVWLAFPFRLLWLTFGIFVWNPFHGIGFLAGLQQSQEL